MPRRLSKPTKIPDDHEQLINTLWRFYIAANGPSTRRVALVIEELEEDQRKGTANHETIRRTLSAIYLPEWQTVEVIFLALCQIANVDPDDDDDSDEYDRWDPPGTHRDRLRRSWRLARYGTVEDLPRTRAEKARQEADQERSRPPDDPWGQAPPGPAGGRYADEPPF